MISLLVGSSLALVFAFAGTPLFIRFLVRKGYGQFVRDDGPTSHHTKRGTPTMGGAVIVASVVAAYFLTHLISGMLGFGTFSPTASGLLVLLLTVGMGMVGFIDDYTKISKQRSLGLNAKAKIILQAAVGITFAVLALQFPNSEGRTPASTAVSFIRDTGVDFAFAGAVLGAVLFVIWSLIIITGTTNGVNLADGLDGLAAGASVLVFGAYFLIGIWQYNQSCGSPGAEGVCYEVRDPMDLALLAGTMAGALIGFLWWNTSPAKIFMGDTGSLAIGGAIAAFAILSRTELLLIILAGLFVIITLSVIIQVGYFKLSGGKRVFKMAPLQHHFELKGWAEVTVVVRFWIIAGLCVAVALGIFYAEWVVGS
ncbi:MULTISPECIES: phospho-N-acetylmuramoyl-pentapeptide-transferase [unclassified Arthrobacter]|uniref:phospho-N-acetylmuramoyl-pentapeptide- transferase n=1 Tax=unclassified Arthrobacter TaxID=235627 RepID=UPI0024DFB653|nr:MULTISPECIES: phospho-N-acetylmuramoyl-pentapeptide-transferase [unclassified Arthrobacter]MCC9145034.1 phospho-N-acetylmuramoyl-pentapeptide-transferase [Arthrobacter sp. zg-Y919]MDK1276262.1 phospho-N-acetylmuramoyl-pentapeptide-transferase [Arthrobacter sp. zg.Y919]MDM7988901.1 phospho-N-acetylmuramoyl-pentapeptide-transferase [Arthrobacter sp. zg-Y877]WIB02131.1 phospho-N-acetylmuramoyl-pentapeptide-transferase [Arthrobacter sp. zg-Y919]